MVLKKGDLVRKVEGYPFPGMVVAVFKTRAGNDRVVVECTARATRGCLHIFSPLQLRAVAVKSQNEILVGRMVPNGRREIEEYLEDYDLDHRVTYTGETNANTGGHKKRVARANGFGRTRGD